MMRHKFKNIVNYLCTILSFLIWPCLLWAEQVTQNDCRSLEPSTQQSEESLKYADALLWKISKDGYEPSYIFGTIHVSDSRIADLPELVSSKLNASDVFVMEALPEPEEALKLSQMMFFDDGRTLKDFIDDKLFDRTAEILSAYQLPPESVTFMQPWAAFLVMNYPAEQGMPLDLQLLNTAEQNGAKVQGLESLSEQGDVFSSMDIQTQIQFLLDTVCNYETISKDFEKMKSFYLARDLQGLFDYSNQYSFSDEQIYKDFIRKLLTDRNHIMVDRMQSVLEAGNAFIAIGAMHLPGHEGVLALLGRKGYRITSIY
ncbi:MAG: hypothetical protein HW411_980 [Gammaproteobacteria bacterium]|nr:hypothetical protein [Gammaproteobacteria bacterium]